MKLLLTLASLLLVATACTDDGGAEAEDPTPSNAPMPTEVPAAEGPVHTRGTATVMDTGTPELCVGPVAESYPPQCGGPEIVGWDWAEQKKFVEEGDVRWGAYFVRGTWDGETFTYEKAIPAALYDDANATPGPTPPPLRQYGEAQLEAIAGEAAKLPGVQSITPVPGQVIVDVVYDDGTLQQWANLEWGANTVVVNSALVS
jgi:hypothetical protein